MSWFSERAAMKFLQQPKLMRGLLGLAQRLNPIFSVGSTTVLTNAEDIRESLERSCDFEYDPYNRNRMLMGPFLLALNPYPVNEEEKEFLGGLLSTLSLPPGASPLDAVVNKACAARASVILEKLGEPTWQVDLVGEYAEPVVIDLVKEFFGIDSPAANATKIFGVSSGDKVLAQWLRKVGSVIATTTPAPFGLQQVAEASAKELTQHLDACANAAWPITTPGVYTTVLGGLLDKVHSRRLEQNLPTAALLNVDELEYVRRNLIGLVLAGSTPLIRAFVHGIDQLFRREDRPMHGQGRGFPEGVKRPPLYAAYVAARAGRRQELETLFFEALRFNPTFPMLTRYCPRTVTVAARTSRSSEIPAGNIVMVPPIAAMFDSTSLPDPDVFGYSRPDNAYMHFGWGGHRCLGESVARTAVVAMALHLLGVRTIEFETLRTFLPAIDRAKIIYDGPAIESYKVTYP